MQDEKIVQNNNYCNLYQCRPKLERKVTLEHIDAVIDDIEELDKIFYNSNF